MHFCVNKEKEMDCCLVPFCYNQLNHECICHIKKDSAYLALKENDKIIIGFTLDCALTTVKYFSAVASKYNCFVFRCSFLCSVRLIIYIFSSKVKRNSSFSDRSDDEILIFENASHDSKQRRVAVPQLATGWCY